MARSSTTFNSSSAIAATRKAHTKEAERKASETKKYNKLIKGDIYAELRKAILTPATKRGVKPFYQEYIEKLVQEARHDPNSPVGRMLAEQIFQKDIITALDAQTEKYLNRDIEYMQFRLKKRLFKEQQQVFDDFVSRKKCSMCSRRAGKTEENVDEMLKIAAIPNSPILYLNLTFDNAIKQTFDKVLEEADRVDLLVVHKSKNEGFIEFSNGSSILFKGNKDRSAADSLQGFHYRLVVIDEAQSQCNMNYLVDTIIAPMLMDFEDSVLYLTGTPPRRKGTYFEQAFLSSAWTHYHWTMKENPYIKNVDVEIERVCQEKGVNKDSAFIKREYFGEMAYDTEAQVFKGYKVYAGTIPSDFVPDHIYGGVDFGFADYNGVIYLAANVEQRRAYTIFERKFNKSTVSQIVDTIREGFEVSKKFLIERNQYADLSNCGIYCDTNEKSITYELSQTYGLPAYNAYKYDRAMAIEQLAEECRTGRILIQQSGPVEEEYEQTLYKRDELDNITSELDEGFHPDITMALLYASRQYFYDCGMDIGGESKNKKTRDFDS